MQEPEIGNFFFGRNHPLKPHRVRLTHELLQAFSLERKLTTLPASRLTTSEMSKYHADEYASRGSFLPYAVNWARSNRLSSKDPTSIFHLFDLCSDNLKHVMTLLPELHE